MADRNGGFKNYVMSFTCKEKRARELEKYKQRVIELNDMGSDELDFEYIALESNYEHKSYVLIMVVSISFVVLLCMWKKFLLFMDKVTQYSSSADSGIEAAKLSFVILLILAVIITFVVLVNLFTQMKDLGRMKKELMIVENVRMYRNRVDRERR